MLSKPASDSVSIKGLVKRFWKISFLTWFLVILEALALVSIPLVIGWAVDDLFHENRTGLIQLAGICGILLFVGAGRRFYDTRAYARINRSVAIEVVVREKEKCSPISTISARLQLFREFIEFLEVSIPDVIQQCINLIGTLVIVITIDITVAAYCFIAALITIVVYWVSDKRIYKLNKGRNTEFEKEVEILDKMGNTRIKRHLKLLNLWDIRFSDLETINYSIIWIALSSVLLLTVFTMAVPGRASIGEVIAAVMYVFGFVESILAFPMYYQQVIRLREISNRLSSPSKQ